MRKPDWVINEIPQDLRGFKDRIGMYQDWAEANPEQCPGSLAAFLFADVPLMIEEIERLRK